MKTIIFLLSLFYFNISLASAPIDPDSGAAHGITFLSSFLNIGVFIDFIFAILILIGTFILSKIIKEKISRYVENETEAIDDSSKEGIIGVISRVSNITIWVIGIAASLGVLGVDIGFFMGGIGIGLGFTMQIFLSNFIYGVIMVTQNTIRNGDVIEIGGTIGRVLKVNSLFTSMKKIDGVATHIPNIKFLQENVYNFTLNNERRLEIEFTLDYINDVNKVKTIINKVLVNVPGVLPTPDSDIWITDISKDGVGVKVLFWVNSLDSIFVIKSQVTETLNLAFKQAGIVVSFNQISISNRSDLIKG